MATKSTLCITKRGFREIKEQSQNLSMLERRLLILSNGKRDIDDLTNIMKRTDLPEISLKLQIAGFLTEIESGGRPAPKQRKDAVDETELAKAMEEVTEISKSSATAQEQMLKALDLLSQQEDSQAIRRKVTASESDEELKELMEEWFEVISENKKNAARAEAFREHVDKTIMSSYMILF